MTLASHDLEFDRIKVGAVFSFKKIVNDDLVDRFADLVGDYNPLHTDTAYAKKNGFEGRLAHGLLVGSLFSTLVGMFCPGRRALYLSQSLNFKEAVMVGNEVLVQGEVLAKSESTRVIKLKTTVYNQKNKVVVAGEALVKVRE